jgi:hypothetical protein
LAIASKSSTRENLCDGGGKVFREELVLIVSGGIVKMGSEDTADVIRGEDVSEK